MTNCAANAPAGLFEQRLLLLLTPLPIAIPFEGLCFVTENAMRIACSRRLSVTNILSETSVVHTIGE